MDPEVITDWTESEHTKALLSRATDALKRAGEQLLGTAMASSDSAVVAAAANVRRYEVIVHMLRKGELDG